MGYYRQHDKTSLPKRKTNLQFERPLLMNMTRHQVPRFRQCPFTAARHPSQKHMCSNCEAATCKRLAELGLDDGGSPAPYADRKTCDARTRRGAPCCNKVVPGMRRCRFHGGLSTGPTSNAGRQRIAEAQRARWQKTKVLT
ncbi:HGGxSTG domain-containing protein [Devosia psychrophila]|uniref:HGGxSTG domain-containing protein n=1 Tax=Devosia psychrophila TaxID=728005 RepID=UPI003CC7A27E